MLVLPVPVLLALGARRLGGGRLSNPGTKLASACGVGLAATALVRAVRDRTIGFRTDIVSIIATPIGGLFAAAVMVASAWRVMSGRGQHWKGRTIP